MEQRLRSNLDAGRYGAAFVLACFIYVVKSGGSSEIHCNKMTSILLICRDCVDDAVAPTSRGLSYLMGIPVFIPGPTKRGGHFQMLPAEFIKSSHKGGTTQDMMTPLIP